MMHHINTNKKARVQHQGIFFLFRKMKREIPKCQRVRKTPFSPQFSSAPTIRQFYRNRDNSTETEAIRVMVTTEVAKQAPKTLK